MSLPKSAGVIANDVAEIGQLALYPSIVQGGDD
jgi:hypothetical protein